jgi:SAM-dependent methyltransferase
MDTSKFLELLIRELRQNEELRNYYRLIDSEKYLLFRKAYLEQRLSYVLRNLHGQNLRVWDVGCGYATTSILLTLSGHQVTGSTLEYYYDKISNRISYWSEFGDMAGLDIRFENIFDLEPIPEQFDIILLQDTLHHLEPVEDALKIFRRMLKKNGKIIVSEENGRNIFCAAKHFKERGFNRITRMYDETTGKYILFGNENTRSFSKWMHLFEKNGFVVNQKHTEFIRFFPPSFFHEENYYKLMGKEQEIWKKNRLLRDFLFFGFNFIAEKGEGN